MWIHLPNTSASTPEPEGLISDSDSRIQTLAASLTWRETRRRARSWLTTCKRDNSMMRLCGQIPGHSTADRGAARWISSLEDSPANRTAQPENDSEPKMNAGSGRTFSESLATWNPEASSWRTSQASFMEELNTYSQGWPRSGSMRNGQVFERPMSARHTDESEFSSWPTATASDVHRPNTKSPESASGHMLAAKAEEWQTPAVAQHAYRRHAGQTERILPGQAMNWWTPDTMPEAPNSGTNTKNRIPGLGNQAKAWLTPSANEDAAGTLKGDMQQMLSHQVQEATGQTSTRDTGLRLNPRFVEWLMGWPSDWLALGSFDSLATGSSRGKPLLLSENFSAD